MTAASPQSAAALPPQVLPIAQDARLHSEGGRHRVTYRVAVPYFGWFWAPLVARRARQVVVDVADPTGLHQHVDRACPSRAVTQLDDPSTLRRSREAPSKPAMDLRCGTTVAAK